MKTKMLYRHHAAVGKLVPIIVGCALSFAGGTARAQIATNFTILNHVTGLPLSLSDYQGNVVVLDFWAYWCEYCQAAASDIEPNLTRLYRARGGNSNGVPVQVISVNIDCSSTSLENSYISTYGLEVVGDDCSWAAYNQFNYGGIPQFAVINCTTNSLDYSPWQILTEPTGYLTNYTVPLLKSYIDSVQTPAPIVGMISPCDSATLASSNVTLTASLATNGKIIKRVEFYSSTTLLGAITNTTYLTITNDTASSLIWNTNYSITWSNVPPGSKSVFVRAIYGANSSVDSPTDNFTVGTLAPIVISISRQGANLILSWTGGTGSYQVQTTSNLFDASWQNCDVAGTNTSMVIGRTNHMAFYRVMQE